jgi:hypothetical protein
MLKLWLEGLQAKTFRLLEGLFERLALQVGE